jgi:signal transduction histidine kinase
MSNETDQLLSAQALRLTRLVRTIATSAALVVAVLVPSSYFFIAYRYEVSHLLSEARMQSTHISEYLTEDAAPLQTEAEKISKLLWSSRNPDGDRQYSVHDATGQLIIKTGPPLSRPTIVRAALLLADRTPVGILQLEISLRPLLTRTLVATTLGFALASLIRVTVWTGPIRVVRNAFERLAESERELRMARERAEAGNRAKSEFLAVMSHELRTPLNAIIGFAEMMNRRMYGPMGNKRYEEYAETILESGSHLLSMVNDVLDLSKADAGELELSEEVVDLKDLMEQAVRMLDPQSVAGRIAVSSHVGPNCPYLHGDSRRILQIVLNLLSNAVKFTEPGGQVKLEASEDEIGGIYLRVSDTGIGLADADIPRALSLFQQVDVGHARKYDGTGLGLPLTKRLIEAHAGSMTLESRYGEGTVVTARFPAHRTLARGSTLEAAPTMALRS